MQVAQHSCSIFRDQRPSQGEFFLLSTFLSTYPKWSTKYINLNNSLIALGTIFRTYFRTLSVSHCCHGQVSQYILANPFDFGRLYEPILPFPVLPLICFSYALVLGLCLFKVITTAPYLNTGQFVELHDFDYRLFFDQKAYLPGQSILWDCSAYVIKRPRKKFQLNLHRDRYVSCQSKRSSNMQNPLDTTLAWGDILTLAATEFVGSCPSFCTFLISNLSVLRQVVWE